MNAAAEATSPSLNESVNESTIESMTEGSALEAASNQDQGMAQVIDLPRDAADAEANAEASDAHTAKQVKEKAAKEKASLDSLDAVLAALNAQDETLKAFKQQIQDMLTNNATIKRSVKQIVQDASKNDEILNELNLAKKKLAMMKTLIG